ncbi:retrovirus-related pol polyprotein from transposon TNT 1-94 [Tanacetum coccineum]
MVGLVRFFMKKIKLVTTERNEGASSIRIKPVPGIYEMVVETSAISDYHTCFQKCQSVKVKEIQERCNIKAFQEWYEHVGPEVTSPQGGKVTDGIVQLIVFIVESGCTKHMTGNIKLLCNFVEKFLGTVRFRNDQFSLILGYGDLIQGNVMIKNGNDLLTAWLWHRRLSHLNFDYINLLSKKDVVIGLPKVKYVKDQLCSSCEVSKAKRSSFKTKVVPSSKGRLHLLHTDLCGLMRVASINGKKYILFIVDDYSRYTWTLFHRSKDETPDVLKDFLMMIQRNLQAQIVTVRTDRGTEFLNKTLHAYFKEEDIEHQTSTPRTPE